MLVVVQLLKMLAFASCAALVSAHWLAPADATLIGAFTLYVLLVMAR